MSNLSINNFRVTLEDSCFVILRWSPDLHLYEKVLWTHEFSDIDLLIKCLYSHQQLPKYPHVVFDLRVQHNSSVIITTRPSHELYPDYSYDEWTFNKKYDYGSKLWKQLMSYKVIIKKMED